MIVVLASPRPFDVAVTTTRKGLRFPGLVLAAGFGCVRPLPPSPVGALSLGILSVLLHAAFDHAFHQLFGEVLTDEQTFQIIQVTRKLSW